MKGLAVVAALAVISKVDAEANLALPSQSTVRDLANASECGGGNASANASECGGGNASARAPALRGGVGGHLPAPAASTAASESSTPEMPTPVAAEVMGSWNGFWNRVAAEVRGLWNRRRRPSPQAPVATTVPVSTFFWNVHWQCSNAARGSSGACKALATQRFRELAQGVDIAAAIELSHGMSQPVELIPGWAQVNGPCARGNGGDSAALAFGPSWRVEASGGGCLRGDWDTRAFAVARVAPPVPVQGCPSLCVVAIHAPHTWITRGHDTVAEVCGAAAERCAIAMGDWNTRARGVGRLWASLIGGAAPALVFPNQRTCCWPETQHFGYFDHVATNIAGASAAGSTVHPYQITGERPWEQHRPVAATIMLPAAR